MAILFFSAYSYKWPFLSWLRLFKAPVHWDNRLCILNKKGYHHGIIITERLLLSEKRGGELGERWKTAWLISCYCLLDQEGRGGGGVVKCNPKTTKYAISMSMKIYLRHLLNVFSRKNCQNAYSKSHTLCAGYRQTYLKGGYKKKWLQWTLSPSSKQLSF